MASARTERSQKWHATEPFDDADASPVPTARLVGPAFGEEVGAAS